VAHWAPKIVHLDLAVDVGDFPPIKRRFGQEGRRRFLYVGHSGWPKNAHYLTEIASLMPDAEFAWIGSGASIRGLQRLGFQDFRTDEARKLVGDYDFLITVGKADANPATILEAMAWGLIPICTRESGYVGHEGIINIPLNNPAAVVDTLRRYLSLPEADLRRLQNTNWQAIREHFNWDRFVQQVINAIESSAAPRVDALAPNRRWRMVVAGLTSPRSLLSPSNVRLAARVVPTKRSKSHDTERARMTTEAAIRALRSDSAFADLLRDSYLGKDIAAEARRFLESGEFREVRRLLGGRLDQARVLDVGAGTGVVSYAFAKSGARYVVAVEPDPSLDIGRGAISRLRGGVAINILGAVGEQLPLASDTFDIVYVRQTLHHAKDLARFLTECARVLRPGGILLACREHVVDDEKQLHEFLRNHPIHRLAGGENAYSLDAYVTVIARAGLRLQTVISPWESVINAFPAIRDQSELGDLPRRLVVQRFRLLGGAVAAIPGITLFVKSRFWRRTPGRLYSFLASK
jgi:SAM-dependent methyltransferase